MLEEWECGGEECFVLVLAVLVPEHLDSSIGNSWSYQGRGRGGIGHTGTGEGRHHHVMVGRDEWVLLPTNNSKECLSLHSSTTEQEYIELGVRVSVSNEVVVGWMVEREVMEVELGENIGKKLNS